MDGLLHTPDDPGAYRCEACLTRRPPGDALTGLADRTLFREQLARTLDGHVPPGVRQTVSAPGTAVLLIDLDRFKMVNDTMGHATGDALLVAAAGRIRSSLRDGDMAARLGGDEFAILLCQVGGHDDVAAVADRLVELLARPFLLSGRVANIGAAIAFAATGVEGDLLLRQADMAMYQAKSEGRNRHCFFRSEMQESADIRVALETDLRAALALGQFELFYQPQLDLKLRQLVGFEALIRWRHPTRGLVPPDDLIPVVEQMDLIPAIGEWVIRQACGEAAGAALRRRQRRGGAVREREAGPERGVGAGELGPPRGASRTRDRGNRAAQERRRGDAAAA